MSDFFSDNGEKDDFWDTMGQEDGTEEAAPEPEAVAAEPAAEVETAEPEAVEEPVAERPRNPDGTFAPKNPDPEPEAQPEAAPDAQELQAQIAQLEKRLADKDDFAGRLSNELGELRKLQEQIAEQQSRPQVSDWDSLIDENPARAAQIALQAGDNYRYQQAREAWNDLAPGAPEVFEQNLRLQRQVAELEQRFTQTTQPMQQAAQTQQIASAYQRVIEQYPDFDKFEDAMAEVVENRPLVKRNLTEALQTGDANEQYAVLEDLYLITAGRKSDTLREAQTQVAQSFAEETLKAKQDAIVVSNTGQPTVDTEKPRTRHDELWDMAAEDDANRAAGWQIGPR